MVFTTVRDALALEKNVMSICPEWHRAGKPDILSLFPCSLFVSRVFPGVRRGLKSHSTVIRGCSRSTNLLSMETRGHINPVRRPLIDAFPWLSIPSQRRTSRIQTQLGLPISHQRFQTRVTSHVVSHMRLLNTRLSAQHTQAPSTIRSPPTIPTFCPNHFAEDTTQNNEQPVIPSPPYVYLPSRSFTLPN